MTNETTEFVFRDLPELDSEQHSFAKSDARLIALSSPPGSGKTESLTARFVEYLRMGGSPHDVLVLTFTNRARESFENRLLDYVPYYGTQTVHQGKEPQRIIVSASERPFMDPTDPNRLWIGTFHEICLRTLRCHPDEAGYTGHPTVVDQDRRFEILSATAQRLGLLSELMEDRTKQLYDYARILETLMTLGLDPTEVPPPAYQVDPHWILKRYRPTHKVLYTNYLQYLKQHNQVDIGDIPRQVSNMFRKSVPVREAWSTRFTWVLVDEYQDTTPLQTHLLTVYGKNAKVAACGDPDQSIFGFAGAEGSFKSLEMLGDTHGQVHTHGLVSDYRLTREIQQAANKIRQKLESPGSKPPNPSDHSGPNPMHFVLPTPDRVPGRIAEDIQEIMKEENAEYSDFLVTARYNKSCVAMGQLLQQQGIPVWIQANTLHGTLQRALRNWLAFAANPDDPWILIQTLCNPPTNMSREILKNPRIEASLEKVPLLVILERNPDTLTGYQEEDFAKMIEPYTKVRELGEKMDDGRISPQAYIEWVLQTSGLKEAANELDAPRKTSFLDYAEQLKTASSRALSASEVHDQSSGANHTGQNPVTGAVEIRNMHQIKGLEWKYVLATGWTMGGFPQRDDKKSLEADRKLALTTITRSQRQFRSYTSEKDSKGHPQKVSQFIREAGIQICKVQ